jgi:hypothetical protein
VSVAMLDHRAAAVRAGIEHGPVADEAGRVVIAAGRADHLLPRGSRAEFAWTQKCSRGRPVATHTSSMAWFIASRNLKRSLWCAIAIEMTIDEDTGAIDSSRILGRFGKVPDDVEASTEGA